MTTVCFRVDAGPVVGGGHLARCRALAEVLLAAGVAVRWCGRGLPADLGAGGLALPGPDAFVTGGAPEAEEVGRWVGASGAAWLVLDHYGYDDAMIAAARHVAPGARILVIDDHQQRHAADLRLAPHQSPAVHTLAGPDYLPFHPAFALSEPLPAGSPAQGLLVSFGGADTQGLALQALTLLAQRLRSAPPITILGAPERQRAGMDALLSAWPAAARRCQALDASAVARLLRESRWALASASTIAWEALLQSCHVVAVPWADNQTCSATALADKGATIETSLTAAVDAVAARIAAGGPSRPSTIDPYGCWRVVAALGFHAAVQLRPVAGELDIRAVVDGDRAAVWRLNNLPDYRRLSFNPAPITWASHLAWWRGARGHELLGCMSGEAVAYARMYGSEVDVVVHPAMRGRGIARALLGRLLRGLRAEAYVLAGNEPSLKLFAALGFHQAGHHPERPAFLRLRREGAAPVGGPPASQEDSA